MGDEENYWKLLKTNILLRSDHFFHFPPSPLLPFLTFSPISSFPCLNLKFPFLSHSRTRYRALSLTRSRCVEPPNHILSRTHIRTLTLQCRSPRSSGQRSANLILREGDGRRAKQQEFLIKPLYLYISLLLFLPYNYFCCYFFSFGFSSSCPSSLFDSGDGPRLPRVQYDCSRPRTI